MRKKLPLVLILSTVILALFIIKPNREDTSIESLRKKHKEYLANSPYKETLQLSKEERLERGLPPNKYFENEWELMMNPRTGKTEFEKIYELQDKLAKERNKKGLQLRSPGDNVGNPWIERGPNNVGGRTRAIIFDPSDTTHKRIFAGGVTGGLWVNDNITNTASEWKEVTGVPDNMAVSCITVDPNNTDIFYLGTGESFTGFPISDGVYKSTDKGVTWTRLLGREKGGISGNYYIQDIKAWNNNGATTVFISVASFSNPASAGIYRTTDGGANWSRVTINGTTQQPNDFEIASDNKIWVSGNSGAIMRSTDGVTFTRVNTISNGSRTELTASKSDPNKFYALSRVSGKPVIYKTTDGFSSYTRTAAPNDSDSGIPADDFTRGQSWYDLVIEVDPTNDEIVYAGGINLFRSANGGGSWSQISKWHSSKPGSYSTVHADQHEMVFRPENPNQAVFGNDGGIYFANNLSTSPTTSNAIRGVNTGYNTTQFYWGGIGPNPDIEYFFGGTQDNGTPYLNRPSLTEPSNSNDISGGDGGYCFIDQVGESYLTTSYVYNNYRLIAIDVNGNLVNGSSRTINSDSDNDGDFINPAELDSNLDILYSNGTKSGNEKIYRYSGLKSIPPGGKADKATLANALLTNSPTAFKVSPYTTTSTTLLVGTRGGELLKITNADGTDLWSEITGSEFLGTVSDIEFGENENELFVTFRSFGVTNIWYTKDGGNTWVGKDGDLPDLPVKTILRNPLDPNEVIIGTELGVWKTNNWNASSPNWEQTFNGMRDARVSTLELRAQDNTILAITYGRGIFSGKFDFNNPTFNIETSVNKVVVDPDNKDAVYTIDYNAFSKFDEDVAFTLAGQPAGAIVTLNPVSPIKVNSKNSFDITISGITNEMLGTFNMTLTGIGGGVTKTLELELVTDSDNDNVSNFIDNCIDEANTDQLDTDNDGEGDVCDRDDDNDTIVDAFDNCPLIANLDQTDTDLDGEGDACDDDDDNDTILDTEDNAPLVKNPLQRDIDGDGIGDVIDSEIAVDGVQVNAETVTKGFSPNGDSTGDTWTIDNLPEIYPNNKVQIFTKSGVLVYEMQDYKNDWDGYSNVGSNEKLPIGAYVYVLVSGEPDPIYKHLKPYVKKGWIYIKY